MHQLHAPGISIWELFKHVEVTAKKKKRSRCRLCGEQWWGIRPSFILEHVGFNHYTHYCGPGYDWHTNQSTNLTVLGTYSGELVRDDAVAYLRTRALQPTRPFFLYVPFQEAHSPFEAPDEYKALYPELAWNSDLQNLAGTVRRVT